MLKGFYVINLPKPCALHKKPISAVEVISAQSLHAAWLLAFLE